MKVRDACKADKQIDEIAGLYCEIWREPPWNENFWQATEVRKKLLEVIEDPEGAALYALSSGNVQGFSWGIVVNLVKMREISGIDLLDFIFVPTAKVFYISELAVGMNARQKGAGELLSKTLMDRALAMGCNVICLRTDIRANAAKALYRKLGFRELDIVDGKHGQRTYWVYEK